MEANIDESDDDEDIERLHDETVAEVASRTPEAVPLERAQGGEFYVSKDGRLIHRQPAALVLTTVQAWCELGLIRHLCVTQSLYSKAFSHLKSSISL